MKRGTFEAGYVSVRTAQGILLAAAQPEGTSAACGSACGAGGGETKPEEPKPAACGSACGAGEK